MSYCSTTIDEGFRLVVQDYLTQMQSEGVSEILPESAYAWLRLFDARIMYAMAIVHLTDLIPEYNTETEFARLSAVVEQLIDGDSHE